MRYVLAILACGAEAMVYIVIGVLLGWTRGGGIVPMMILFAVCGATWVAITKRRTSSVSEPAVGVGPESGTSGEGQRLLGLAERLAQIAWILALTLDKAAAEVVEASGADYPAMSTRNLFFYTMGGVGTAILTGAPKVIETVGRSHFEVAIDQGRSALEEMPLVPEMRKLFHKRVFDAAVLDLLKWIHLCEAEGKSSASQTVGVWIWNNIQDQFQGRAREELAGRIINGFGSIITAQFGAYWLSEKEIEAIRLGREKE